MPSGWWRYEHADLDEPRFPDGSAVRRPIVTVGTPGSLRDYVAVIDSGSPVSVADSRIFSILGIDIDRDKPLFEIPLGIGGAFSTTPVFEVELELRSPHGEASEAIAFRLQLGASVGWRMPFMVLFGQRGWFDCFPTTINGSGTTVELFP